LTEFFHTNIKINVNLVHLTLREYGVSEQNKPTLSSWNQ